MILVGCIYRGLQNCNSCKGSKTAEFCWYVITNKLALGLVYEVGWHMVVSVNLGGALKGVWDSLKGAWG